MDAFVFSYGCVVFWGGEEADEKAFLNRLQPFEEKPGPLNMDEFEFSYGMKPSVKNDMIRLKKKGSDVLQKLSVSYALSQSSKLAVFEDRIDQTIQGTRYIPQDLATRGLIKMSRKETAKMIGLLFLERHSVNLHTDILDTPAFFWDSPEFESLYMMTRADLDVNARTAVLNTRLDMVRELFEVMGDVLNTRHSTFLEWIIILLITSEVIFTLLIHVFKVL